MLNVYALVGVSESSHMGSVVTEKLWVQASSHGSFYKIPILFKNPDNVSNSGFIMAQFFFDLGCQIL